jgi:predicted nucleic acid-binding protein
MSAIAWSEFLCGPLEDSDRELATQVVQERTSFTPEDAEITARLFNKTARKRGTLMDCMIAATAIRIGAPLATSP